MTRRHLEPDQIAQAVALREAGYTVLAISQRLGTSVRTIQRHLTLHGATKGKVKAELVAQAKAELLIRITSDDSIREEAALLISDNLAHARHLREIMIRASEKMEAESLKDCVLVMRASAAYSTALKNTSDVIRSTLGTSRLDEAGAGEIADLIIQEMTAEDVERVRQRLPLIEDTEAEVGDDSERHEDDLELA